MKITIPAIECRSEREPDFYRVLDWLKSNLNLRLSVKDALMNAYLVDAVLEGAEEAEVLKCVAVVKRALVIQMNELDRLEARLRGEPLPPLLTQTVMPPMSQPEPETELAHTGINLIDDPDED
jgi:hypothetical protein